MWAMLLLVMNGYAADGDGDGVDASTDCDDGDATVWRSESSSSSATLTTDAEVAAYCTSYCSRKPSALTLTGVSTTEGLSCVTSTATLTIKDSFSLRSLDGLDGLGGTTSLTLKNLPALDDMSGLSGLTKLTTAQLEWLPSLTDLEGLNNVTSSAGNLIIVGTPRLSDLSALGSLTTVSGTLSIGCLIDEAGGGRCFETPLLESLAGLDALTSVKNLALVRLSGLRSLEGLGALTKVSGALQLDGLGITDLTGLDRLTQANTLAVGCHLDEVWIRDSYETYRWACLGNDDLESLDGAETLTSVTTLKVVNNPSLARLGEIDLTSRLEAVEVAGNDALITLEDMGPISRLNHLYLGCFVPYVMTGSYGGSVLVCPGEASLETPLTVTADTVGTVALVGLASLETLSPLASITTADNVSIGGALTGDALEGLGLETVNEQLAIGCVPVSLDSDEWFERLSCRGTSGLSALDGLEAMSSVNQLSINNNRDLSDVSALHGLSFAGSASIVNNRSLSTSDANALIAAIDRVGGTTVSGNKP